MIGFFDSGFGGLTIMKEVVKILPNYACIYLGDNARTPYGSRSKKIIRQYTIEGVEELFRRGASLIILACNTSSAVALRKIQQEWLPKNHPDKKVLGIFVPTVENMKKTKSKSVGIFATKATVLSKAYEREIAKIDPKILVTQKACPLLVPMIEAGRFDRLDLAVKKYARELFGKNNSIDTIILGCTHYAIIENIFRKHLPKNVRIVSQGKIVAQSLKKYLHRHPEIEKKLQKNGRHKFLTTKKSPNIEHLAELFYGRKIKLNVVKLGRKSYLKVEKGGKSS